MLPVTFPLSKKTYALAKQRMYFISFIFLLMPLMFLFTPMGVNMPWLLVLSVFGGIFFLLLLYIVFFSHKLIKSQLGTLRFILTEVDLIRKNRGIEEHFLFSEMKQVVIQKSRKGDVIGLRIKSSKKPLLIGGNLENIEQLAQLLQNQLPASVTVKTKTVWFNMQNPITLGLFMFGCSSLVIFFAQMPYYFIQNIQLISLLSTPLIFIFLRPISKVVGAHYRKKEKLLGYFMLVAAIFAGGMLLWTRDFKVLDFPPCSLVGRYVQQSDCIRSFDLVSSISFLPDNETIVADLFESVVILPINGRMNYWTPKISHDDYVMDFWVSENGRILASTTYEGGTFLHFWDLETKKMIKTIQPNYRSFTLSPDGQNVAISDEFNESPTIEIWQLQPWEKTEVIQGYSPFAYSPDGSLFVNVDPEENVVVRNLQTGEIVSIAENPNEGKRLFIDNFVFSSDGDKFAGILAHKKSIYVWETATGQVIHSWEIETSNQFLIAGFQFEEEVFTITPDNQFLIAGFQDGQDKNGLFVWNLTNGDLHKEIELGEGLQNRAKSIDISPDGSLIAVATYDSVLIYDFETFLE